MTTYVLRNGQSDIVQAGEWNGGSLELLGTAAGAGAPTATFVGADTLSMVTDTGTAAQPGTGIIDLMPGGTLTTAGLTVRDATLSVSERPGTSVTFDGSSTIANDSTLTATGYGGVSNYVVNGTMTIKGASTVNMDYVSVGGTGHFHLTGAASLLRLGSAGTGDTVVLDSGMLSLTNGLSFLGTITDSAPATSRIGATAGVELYNAMSAATETFNTTTGVLTLFNATGSVVADLKFAGHGDLYATPSSGLATNYIAISAHQSATSLHVTFTH